MNNIATIILARKGSKQIPKKNIILFKGKPLIEWTIIDALAIGYPIWLFTDMKEIREICKKYPKVNIREKMYENKEGIHHTDKEILKYNEEIQGEHIILLQATSPIRNVNLIKEWINAYINGNFDVGFTAFKMQPEYYYKKNGNEINYDNNKRTYNGCEKQNIYKETGSFYIFKTEILYNCIKNHFMNTVNKILFEDPYNIDIDNPEDIRKEK